MRWATTAHARIIDFVSLRNFGARRTRERIMVIPSLMKIPSRIPPPEFPGEVLRTEARFVQRFLFYRKIVPWWSWGVRLLLSVRRHFAFFRAQHRSNIVIDAASWTRYPKAGKRWRQRQVVFLFLLYCYYLFFFFHREHARRHQKDRPSRPRLLCGHWTLQTWAKIGTIFEFYCLILKINAVFFIKKDVLWYT